MLASGNEYFLLTTLSLLIELKVLYLLKKMSSIFLENTVYATVQPAVDDSKLNNIVNIVAIAAPICKLL